MPTFKSFRFTEGLAMALILTALPCGSEPVRTVLKVREQSLAVEKGGGFRIDRPYFDPAGQLAWSGSPVSRPGGDLCDGGAAPSKRVTHLLVPRVDEVGCASPPKAVLLGLDTAGKTVWRRDLGFRSGSFTFDEIVVGATREGIVLNNLTVLAPGTGKVLFPPPTHPVGQEARPVPDHDLAEATIYLPARRAFATFEAEVTLFERSGGVYLLDPGTGKRDLLLPVSTTLLGGHWRVEAMALDSSGRYLLLGHRFAFRGPGGVSCTVFDLTERRAVYEERFIEDHYGGGLAFAADGRGNVGFAFQDLTAGRQVLVHYRVAGAKRQAEINPLPSGTASRRAPERARWRR